MTMKVDTAIKNGRIVSPQGICSAGIGIKGEKIVAIAKDNELLQADKVIDAKENYVLPGLVDAHCHLDWPFDIDLATHCKKETQAYGFGGVTTISHMLTGVGDLVGLFRDFVAIYEQNGCIDLSLSPEITTEDHIKEIRELVELGMIAFKMQPPYKGTEARPNIPGIDDGHIYLTFKEIGKLAKDGYKVFCRIHCEDIEIFLRLKDRAIKQGVQPRSWNEIRPPFIEEAAMRKYVHLANLVSCPLYIVHMTIKEGLDVIVKARSEGMNVVAETCPHYLIFNVDNTDRILSKVNPPIRTKEDNDRLWKGIKDGVISVVATDHAPSCKKHKPDFWTGMGFTTAESWLPIMLSEGVNKGRISLEKLVEVCCYNPARIFGLFPKKGVLAVGSDADLVIVDLNREATVVERPVYSGADYTPYAGLKFKGWPILTMLRGSIIMNEGTVIGKSGFGRYIPAKAKE